MSHYHAGPPFGDANLLRKMWATFNEAWTFTHLASGYGKAPSIQPYMDVNVWPKVAGHNVPRATSRKGVGSGHGFLILRLGRVSPNP